MWVVFAYFEFSLLVPLALAVSGCLVVGGGLADILVADLVVVVVVVAAAAALAGFELARAAAALCTGVTRIENSNFLP